MCSSDSELNGDPDGDGGVTRSLSDILFVESKSSSVEYTILASRGFLPSSCLQDLAAAVPRPLIGLLLSRSATLPAASGVG